LPAAGNVNPAFQTAVNAVPRRITSFIMSTMSHVCSGSITGSRRMAGCHRMLPWRSSTRSTPTGSARVPSVANAVYAAMISIGRTPLAPMWIEDRAAAVW